VHGQVSRAGCSASISRGGVVGLGAGLGVVAPSMYD
jgi:hypothetical protein